MANEREKKIPRPWYLPYINIISSPHTASISVIMPCYNAEATLQRAVESIRAQSIDNWELIIVNDGSEDDTASIASSYAAKDKRIRLINRPHEGVVAASNAGFEASCGDLIARMDADDASHPNRLKRQLEELRKYPQLGAVSCLAHFAGNKITAAGYAHHVDWTNRHLSVEEIALNRFIDLPFPHPTLMYRRELIEQHGPYHAGDFPEDYQMILRWLAAGVRIGKVNELLYNWHDPPTRLSRNDERYAMEAFHSCKAPYLADAIEQSGCIDRELWIWGAGRPARKCANHLEKAWKKASGYIDVDPLKIGRQLHGRPVVSADEMPPAKQAVIASYVATRGAGDCIRKELSERGRLEGRDFWICA